MSAAQRLASLDADAVLAAAASAWEPLLGLTLTAVTVAPPGTDAAAGTAADLRRVTSSVVVALHGTATWQVELLLTDGVERDVAAAMLVCELDELTEDDVQDAVAELGNVIAGGLARAVPGAGPLSLPTVAAGADRLLPEPDARPAEAGAGFLLLLRSAGRLVGLRLQPEE